MLDRGLPGNAIESQEDRNLLILSVDATTRCIDLTFMSLGRKRLLCRLAETVDLAVEAAITACKGATSSRRPEL